MKRVTAVLVVMVFAFMAVSTGLAVAQEEYADPADRAVAGTMKTVGEAAKGTTETAVSPIVAFWRWMTGKGDPDKIVTDPVSQGGKTVYDASKNTGETLTGKNQ